MSWEDGGHKVTLGSWECHVCGDLVFLSLNVCRKRLFLLIKIIELCVNDQRIHKVCRFDHCQMFTSKLSYFEGFLYDDNPKAWQEIGQPVGWGALPLSIFYDLQIETKVSLSLRNFVVALSVCVCVFFPPHRSYSEHTPGAVGSHVTAPGGTVGGSVSCSRTPLSWYWKRRECWLITPPPTIPAGPTTFGLRVRLSNH